jgi:hypothetical protein
MGVEQVEHTDGFCAPGLELGLDMASPVVSDDQDSDDRT